MQTRVILAGLVVASMTLDPSGASASAVVGQPAPAFSLTDSTGRPHALADYKGKLVVLEWVNPECPFVKKHYGTGNMQKLQKEYTAQGVVWLTVNTSAPGKQGHLTGETGTAVMKEQGWAPTALLLDGSGVTGRAYGARTTPHMFVIDTSGTVVYAGAIDDKPSTDSADIATANNYVRAALDATLAGRKVSTSATQPYGCSVKY